MAQGGDAKVIEDTWYHCYQMWLKNKQSIPEETIIHFLHERAPALSVPSIFKVMVGAGIFKKQIDGYVPKPPKT